MAETFKEKCEIFFADPGLEPGDEKGTLHLLRRDIAAIPLSASWMKLVGSLAGFDLLAQFYAGNNEHGKSGERYKAFLKKFVFENEETNERQARAEVIYKLRCGFMHSFSLTVRETKKVWNFSVGIGTQPETPVVLKLATRIDVNPPIHHFFVDIQKLLIAFEESIPKYKHQLESEVTLQKNFDLMYKHYGSIRVISEGKIGAGSKIILEVDK